MDDIVYQTVKEVRATISKHKGGVYMDALVRDDTWAMQVLKADVLHYLKLHEPADVSPVYTSVKNGGLYLHSQHV